MTSRATCMIWVLATLAIAPTPAHAEFHNYNNALMVSTDAWRYADIADLFGSAPIVLHAKISRATALRPTPAAPPPATRFYIEADVVALIRGTQSIAPHLAWLVDVAPDSRGKQPKLRKQDVLVAAWPVPGRPGEVRLAARDGQQPWSPALDARVRAVLAEATAPDAPPVVTGVASAFHSAGSIPGEGETQIFLSTTSAIPVSLTVLRRPDQPPRWAFAIGEIVDEAAIAPKRDTIGWYRLACFLPRDLPDHAVGELSADDAAAARRDYDFVIGALGTCPRLRQR